MVTMFYIGEDLCIFQPAPHVYCGCNIINSPAFVVQSYCRESLAPPAVTVRFGVKVPENIYPAACQELIHPCSFLGQEASGILVAFGIMDIYFLMRDIVVAAEDDLRIRFTECVEIGIQFIEPHIFERLPDVS